MADLFKSKENEFYIELKEERFYIPGEDISGDVILDLQKQTKTNNIRVTLEGTVTLGDRTFTLFSKSILIAESLDGQKSHYLEAHTHRFPFRITIPSAKTHKIPSTLEIPKLLKVTYRLVAIYNKAFTLEKFCPTTSIPVNILEDINVEKAEFAGDKILERELFLTNETKRKVKVTARIKKRAAVKGDEIPISITIQHIGVMVRDKAITAQLMRSVYYGKNKSEIVGPKMLREVTSDIIILGPVSFTKTFDLKLPLPLNICPTVEDSGEAFKIEYFLRIRVNLNEENPLQQETDNDIVIFNAPFIIGTYPKLAFSIDDDEEEVEREKTDGQDEGINATEMDQVAEKMKNMDLEFEAAVVRSPTPSFTNLQEANKVTHANSINNSNNETTTPSIDNNQLDLTASDSPELISSPPLQNMPYDGNHSVHPPNCHPVVSPDSPALPPIPALVQRQDSIASSLHRTSTTSSTHSVGLERQESINTNHPPRRQESVRWAVNKEEEEEDIIPTSIPSPQPYMLETPQPSFVMPTPVLATNNNTPYYTPQYNSYMSIPVPQQSHYTPPYPPQQYPPSYPQVDQYGYPLPQPSHGYPPPPQDNYGGMPSHFNYPPSNQPYPYYNN